MEGGEIERCWGSRPTGTISSDKDFALYWNRESLGASAVETQCSTFID